jgi:hypothetical protein
LAEEVFRLVVGRTQASALYRLLAGEGAALQKLTEETVVLAVAVVVVVPRAALVMKADTLQLRVMQVVEVVPQVLQTTEVAVVAVTLILPVKLVVALEGVVPLAELKRLTEIDMPLVVAEVAVLAVPVVLEAVLLALVTVVLVLRGTIRGRTGLPIKVLAAAEVPQALEII